MTQPFLAVGSEVLTRVKKCPRQRSANSCSFLITGFAPEDSFEISEDHESKSGSKKNRAT